MPHYMRSIRFKMSKTLFHYVMSTLQLRFNCIQQFPLTLKNNIIVDMMRSCFSKKKETSLSLYSALEYSAHITPIRINHAIVKTNNTDRTDRAKHMYTCTKGIQVDYFLPRDAAEKIWSFWNRHQSPKSPFPSKCLVPGFLAHWRAFAD